MSTVWSYWELKPGTPQNKIAYYDLIWRTVLRNLRPETRLILLTPENLSLYLPSLHPMVHRTPFIAQRVDYIRVAALYHHGGVWIDLDTLLVRDLEYFLHLGRSYPFVAVNYSVDHYDHESYFWVHDPLMVSHPKGGVITSFYNLFNQYFDDCARGRAKIERMPYDQSSRLLTRSLRDNGPESYFLLAHNDLDKIPQHMPHIWFKPLKKLRSSEREILTEYGRRCKINICGSAHLNAFIRDHLKMDLGELSNDAFIDYLLETPFGHMLKEAGLAPEVDGFQFQLEGISGRACPYRKIAVITGLHRFNEEVWQAFFYRRERLVTLDASALKGYLVVLSIERKEELESLLEPVLEQLGGGNRVYWFPLSHLDRSAKTVAALTSSIRVSERVERVPSETSYDDPSHERRLPEDLTDCWPQPTSGLDQHQPLTGWREGLPFLAAEEGHSENRIERFPYRGGWLVLYETFSRGVLLAELDSEETVRDHWHLAHLITDRDPNRFLYSNSRLRSRNKINCNNDVLIRRWPEVAINGLACQIDLELTFDRYLKRERYEGFYKRFLLNYRLTFDGHEWEVFLKSDSK
jgi:hypothetical protein